MPKKGGALIGVNSFTLDGDEAAISDAKDVLAKKGATYQNVYFASDGEAGKFTANIFAYPTTYVVDRNGNIVGDPIVGAITEQDAGGDAAKAHRPGSGRRYGLTNEFISSEREDYTMYRRVLPLLLTAVLLLSGCAAGQKNMPQKTDEKEMTGQPSDMSGEGSMYMDTTENVIYLAGGCFWGMEQLMQSIPGVIDARERLCQRHLRGGRRLSRPSARASTGFRETVRVEYDPGQVSLDALLLAYFYVIDPTVENRQGNDRGSQYQTGVYYTNESAKETVERIAEIERGRSEKFFVEIGPLKNYYPAEEYHQNYLEKNPNGYCHIPQARRWSCFSRLRIDPGDYQKPAAESIRDKLTAGAVPRHAGERHGARLQQASSGTSSKRASMWTSSPASRSFPPRTSSRAAAAGRLSQSPSRSLPWWSWRT